MANLIPPDAKHAVMLEYWTRVVSVWFMLIGFALIVVTALLAPTYVLVQTQLSAFTGAYNEAIDLTRQFTEAEETVRDSNQLAALLVDDVEADVPTEFLAVIDTIAGASVSVQQLTFTLEEDMIQGIVVTGIADTRLSLANFSKDIEAHPLFDEAELPISSLAKDKDIAFTITIKPAAQ